MRRVVSLLLVIAFGIPSLFGVGLHALMPHGVDGSLHVHTGLGHVCCHVLQEHGDESASEHVIHTECDSDENGASWQKCSNYAAHDDDCVICLFCMSHKTALVFAPCITANVSVARATASPDILLEQVRLYTPCGRGPPRAAVLLYC